MSKFTILITALFLSGCVGPTLLSIDGYKITVGSIVTMPIKKKVIEEIKKKEETKE